MKNSDESIEQLTEEEMQLAFDLFEKYSVVNIANKLERKERGFGRYLHAARLDKGFIRKDLAYITGIAFDVLVEIELGQYPIEHIQDDWVISLANTLDEDIDTLNLILGRQKSDLVNKEMVDKFVVTLAEIVTKEKHDLKWVARLLWEKNIPRDLAGRFILSVGQRSCLSEDEDPLKDPGISFAHPNGGC